jgi:hypothetical protein
MRGKNGHRLSAVTESCAPTLSLTWRRLYLDIYINGLGSNCSIPGPSFSTSVPYILRAEVITSGRSGEARYPLEVSGCKKIVVL